MQSLEKTQFGEDIIFSQGLPKSHPRKNLEEILMHVLHATVKHLEFESHI